MIVPDVLQLNPAHWKRNYHNKRPLQQVDPNTLISKLPISPSARTKQKLSAFHFDTQNRGSSLEKENVETSEVNRRHEADAGLKKSHATATDVVSAQDVERPTGMTTEAMDLGESDTRLPAPLPHAHTFPCTPGTRLSLEDLIGDLDETTKRIEQKEKSPEEQIGWIPNSSSTLITPRRPQKRARSSSPSCPTTSSQRNEPFIAYGVQGDEKDAPEADPVADLWQTYAAGKGTAERNKFPDFHGLLFQASPRPFETPVKNSSLRRWASTGNEWPSAANKRRRLDMKHSVEVWGNAQTADVGGTSKLAAMVDRLQQSLTSHNLTISPDDLNNAGAPSSSSPLPNTIAGRTAQELVGGGALRPTSVAHSLDNRASAPPPRMGALLKPLKLNEEVEQDKERIELQETIRHHPPPDDRVAPAPLHLRCKAPLPAFKRPTLTRVPSTSGRHYPVSHLPTEVSTMAITREVDEFGDDDFDITVEDLESLTGTRNNISQSTLTGDAPVRADGAVQSTLVETKPLGKRIPEDAPDSDEYGDDDLDEDALVQVEITATQQFTASDPFIATRSR